MNKKNKSTLVLVISVIVLSLVVFGLTISKTRILSNVKLFNFSFSNNKKLKGDVSNPSSDTTLSTVKLYDYDPATDTKTLLTTITSPNPSSVSPYVISENVEVHYINVETEAATQTTSCTLYKVNNQFYDTDTFRVSPGSNSLDIRCVAEDETRTDYSVYVVKNYVDSNKLSNLSISGSDLYDENGELTTFDPDVTSYKAFISKDPDSEDPTKVDDDVVNIYATPELWGANVNITSTEPLHFGDNTFNIKVKGVDLPENTYTMIVNVTKTTSDDAYLENINIGTDPINDYGVEFYSDVFEYYITLPNDECQPTITPVGKDGQTITVSGSTATCDALEEITIEVTAENGENSNTYKVYITRIFDIDTRLTDLVVKNGHYESIVYVLTPEFNPDTKSYNVTVPYDVDDISIGATSSSSQVSIDFSRTDEHEEDTLVVGTNEFTITCSAAGATDTKYTLTITREGPSLNKLSGLAINGYSISPNFNPDINNYTATVPYEVESIFVVAENNTQIPLTITGDGNHDLIVGQNTINIDVTPPGGTANRYTIQVTRLDNVEFDDLDIDNGIAVINEPMNVSQIKEKAGVSYNPIILDEDKNEKADTSKVKTGDFLRIGGHDYPISLLGDYYKDGAVNLFDINALYTDYVEGTIPTDDEAKLKAGDYYKDNSLNLFDVQALYEWYLGL